MHEVYQACIFFCLLETFNDEESYKCKFCLAKHTLFTHQPIKFLQIAKAIKPEIPKTKLTLLILSEQSVRINYETSRFKCTVT